MGKARTHSDGQAGNRETTDAAGKPIRQSVLFENENDSGKYRYSRFVTDLELPPKTVYDPYRGRTDSGNRIKELEYDFSIDDLVTDNFRAPRLAGTL